MSIVQRFLGGSPFPMLLEHTKKVHECVELLRPITKAMVAGDTEQLEKLHHQMSGTEHEADQIKTEIRAQLSEAYLLSVGRNELTHFLTYQDNVADAAEDYAVVALLRPCRLPEEVHEDFCAFVNQVVAVSEHLLALAEELSLLAESAFTGREANKVIEGAERIGEEEWKADKLERRFARRCYELEEQLGPVTIMFMDKYCSTLSAVANNAEKAAKYLRQIVGRR